MEKENNKIILQKNTKIYIFAPANTYTGGPECLHQLAYHLKQIFRVKTLMFYLPNEVKKPTHEYFKHYKVKFTKIIQDKKENILIMPEHYLYLKEGLKYSKIRKIIWWLSLDNYFGFKFRYQNTKLLRSIIKIPFNLISIFNKLTSFYFGILSYHDYLKFIYKFEDLKKQSEISQADKHLMQSYYSYDYLKKDLNNLEFLFDFQNKKIIQNSKYKSKKENIICYSHKSGEFLKFFIQSNDKKFIELKNFSAKQIIEIFRKSKIYIDFGYHPGKDKMPREAALFNNCIITNTKGSAYNSYDIPINKKFKFKQRNSEIKKLDVLIEKIFKNYKEEIKLYGRYKKQILNEEKNFKKQLLKIFKK